MKGRPDEGIVAAAYRKQKLLNVICFCFDNKGKEI
jgi:hypothetical protein